MVTTVMCRSNQLEQRCFGFEKKLQELTLQIKKLKSRQKSISQSRKEALKPLKNFNAQFEPIDPENDKNAINIHYQGSSSGFIPIHKATTNDSLVKTQNRQHIWQEAKSSKVPRLKFGELNQEVIETRSEQVIQDISEEPSFVEISQTPTKIMESVESLSNFGTPIINQNQPNRTENVSPTTQQIFQRMLQENYENRVFLPKDEDLKPLAVKDQVEFLSVKIPDSSVEAKFKTNDQIEPSKKNMSSKDLAENKFQQHSESDEQQSRLEYSKPSQLESSSYVGYLQKRSN